MIKFQNRIFIKYQQYFYSRYEYELVVVPGLTLNQSVTPIIRLTAKEPPMFVNPEDLGGVSSAGLVYTMGVRLKSPEVSDF